MILTIIVVIISLLIISVNFSAKYVGQGQQSKYVLFVLINVLVFIVGVTVIYYISRNDEKGVRFLILTLCLMLAQIVLALLSALLWRFLRGRRGKGGLK